MSDLIRVNGNQMSWGSILLKLDQDVFTGFTGISFSDKRERVKAYGMGRHHAPRGRSRGKYTVDPVKLTGWKKSIHIFRAQLAARAKDSKSYGDVEFQIVVQYVEEGDDPALTVVIERCVWSGNSSTDEESADPLKEEIEIDAMLIRRDDLVLFDASQGSP
jgi:hypothetical protein